MSLTRKIAHRTERRMKRVRQRFQTNLPRVSVFRSSNHIYAQIIDDVVGKTLASSSSLGLQDRSGDKKAIAYEVGKQLAQRATAQGLTVAAFDRGAFRFHGRIKALAEGLKEGGLRI